MYLVNIRVGESKIHGKGVFTEQALEKDTIVWKFIVGYDKTLSLAEFEKLSTAQKDYLDKVAYLSGESNQYIFPPENDPALYTNHDGETHNLTATFNRDISEELYFIANRDIASGEELTNNYHEFDAVIKLQSNSPQWLK